MHQSTPLPHLIETTLGGFLQDIGKFMQRAHGSLQHMQPAVRARDSSILPPDGHGGYTHKHALWTEAFFQWMEDQGLSFPHGVNLHRVRDMAVYHHSPEAFGPLGWLAAEADRLSSGMDRKPVDETMAAEGETKGWDRFIRTAMVSPFSHVDLGFGNAAVRRQRLAELVPDERLLPQTEVDTTDYKKVYARLWEGFTKEFSRLCREDNLALFCEGFLSLSERYTWAIPSSTVDLPDVSLHDHNRTVAAIAACLYRWHEEQDTLFDEAAIRDRQQAKFRFLAGDLSGIQSNLFLLANQQVKGVNKILRARSFLMGMLLEAAALKARATFDVPVFNLIQSAGGRFLLLIPNQRDANDLVERLRQAIERWLQERYLGELALNLALSPAFAGQDFMPPGFQKVHAGLNQALEAAKQQPLSTCATGVLGQAYDHGECHACGVRPASQPQDDTWRCQVCHDEHRVGGWLPKKTALTWQQGRPASATDCIRFFDDLYLCFHEQIPRSSTGLLSGVRLYRPNERIAGKSSGLPEEPTPERPWALRFLANYVPRLCSAPDDEPRYWDLSDEARGVELGDLKTFEHLARDARELDASSGQPVGKSFLAVLKADVDRLGLIFGFGLSHSETENDRATLSRFAALSRMLDLFFTGYLQHRLHREHPDTYTVYAGGDDLLLIGPWRQTILLAEDLYHQFRGYTGENPNITLSAGIELMKDNHPLNRSVWRAEARLERAKDAGRDQVSLIDSAPITWRELHKRIGQADKLNNWLRHGDIPTATLYKLLAFAEERRRADHEGDIACASWRARWGYHLARNIRDNKHISEAEKGQIMVLLNHLLGLDERIQVQSQDASPRIPVSMALYRNRT